MKAATLRSFGRRARWKPCQRMVTGGVATDNRDAVCLVFWTERGDNGALKRHLVDMTTEEAEALASEILAAVASSRELAAVTNDERAELEGMGL